MLNRPDHAPHAGVFGDIHRLYDLTEVTPGLPMPNCAAVRATFDYRHVIHAEHARAAVAAAETVLSREFGVTFADVTETAGDGTPRYLRVAGLPSGLTLVIISRFTADLDEDAPAGRELVTAAA